jgi:tetratricopeptide (TPR) repeat protein
MCVSLRSGDGSPERGLGLWAMPTSPRPRPRPSSTGRPADRNERGSGASGGAPRRGSADRAGAAGAEFRPRPPRTEAERRSLEVKARRSPRLDAEAMPIEGELTGPLTDNADRERWVPDRWQDEGPMREVAQDASARARGERVADQPAVRERKLADPKRLEPTWVEEVQRESTAATSARYMERLTAATEALERDRYRDALRMVSSVLKNLPNVGAAHEVAGISYYRLGEWRKAISELEQARSLHPAPEQLPVLADCYRALRRYRDVDAIWTDIRESSPAPNVMAEGRIVAAGALADQGDIAGALKLLLRVADAPKRVRDYHLKQWYVIGDLYDRSGDIVKARNFFKRVASVDPRYADVGDRLATLGRR